MSKKKSHVSHSSHDVVIDNPEDDQPGLSSSMDAYVEPSVSGGKGPKLARERMNTVFKAESTRTSEKSQYTARNLKGKYYGMKKAVKMSTPQYQGNTHIGYIILFLQFLRTAVDIWWHSRKISTRAMRKIVVIEIALMIFLGFVFTLAGVFKVTRHEDDDSSDFYWAMTLVATVVLSLAIVGSIGIFRPSIKTTEIFAVLSFIFGHLIFSIVVSWYLLVVLDSVLSDKLVSGITCDSSVCYVLTSDTRVILKEAKVRRKPRVVIDNNIYKDTFLQDYFKLLIVISLVMVDCAGLCLAYTSHWYETSCSVKIGMFGCDELKFLLKEAWKASQAFVVKFITPFYLVATCLVQEYSRHRVFPPSGPLAYWAGVLTTDLSYRC